MSGFVRNQVFKVKDQPSIATFVNLFLVEENFNFEVSISWKGISSGGIQKKNYKHLITQIIKIYYKSFKAHHQHSNARDNNNAFKQQWNHRNCKAKPVEDFINSIKQCR